AIKDYKARLVSWHGGNMRNAIPFKAETVMTLPEDNLKGIKKLVKSMKEQFESEFKLIEDNVDLTLKKVDRPKAKMALDDQTTIVRTLYACHDGVVRFIPAYPNVVETSSNLAIIDIEDGKAAVQILARSAREDMKDYIVKMLMTCFHLGGFKVETGGDYIGWDPNPDSEALHMLLDLYKKLFKEEGIVQVDHAGLECSIILGKYPHMDVVSFGPTLRSPHTTIERAYIPAAEPFWKLLVKALEEAPVKK
ncbi:MAG: cytosol nonspecific dipeptidase, partial [Muribaculaceae bacterium]|nr:cytosol nonspecific dipeptidase [Muribaculaceae bacterium]